MFFILTFGFKAVGCGWIVVLLFASLWRQQEAHTIELVVLGSSKDWWHIFYLYDIFKYNPEYLNNWREFLTSLCKLTDNTPNFSVHVWICSECSFKHEDNLLRSPVDFELISLNVTGEMTVSLWFHVYFMSSASSPPTNTRLLPSHICWANYFNSPRGAQIWPSP